MCYTPITIRNNSRAFLPRYDKVLLQVPCGHCGACRAQKQSDWYTRSYFEYLDAKKKGGYTLFVTLTYNDRHLPHFDLNGKQYVGFWKPDYQHFMSRLRIHLRRRYGIAKEAVKVFWTSEYGGTTKRPHYHALVYVYGNYITPSAMRHLITEDWIHGFVYFGRNGGVLENPSAIKYVAKYITKDLDFFDAVDKHDLTVCKKDHYEFYKFLKNTCFPFHCNSQQYGMPLATYVDRRLVELGQIFIPNLKGNYDAVRVPQYVDRKLYYYRDPETNSYRLTREGINIKIARIEKLTPKLRADAQSLFDNLRNYMDDSFMHDVNYYTNKDYIPEDIISIFDAFMRKYTIDDYFNYVEKDRYMLIYDDVFTFPSPVKFNSHPSLLERLSKHFHTLSEPVGKYGTLASDNALFCEALQNTKDTLYTYMENFAKIVDACKFALGCRKEAEYLRRQRNFSKSKKIKAIYDYHEPKCAPSRTA